MARPVNITPDVVAEWHRLREHDRLEVGEAADRLGVSLAGLYKADNAGRGGKAVKMAFRPGKHPKGPPRPGKAAQARRPPKGPRRDVLEELDDLLTTTKAELAGAIGTKSYAAIGSLLDKIANRINAIQLSRKEHGTEAATLLAKGPTALAKIRQGREALALREVVSGCCAACGGRLSEEQVTERKARTTG